LLAAATVGTVYNQFHSGNGGIAPYTFAVTSGSLPPGFTLTSGGALSGMPTNAGNYAFSITATDANGCTGTNNYSLAANCGFVAVGPATLPDGVAGSPYNQTMTAGNGTAPYVFSVSSGNLPPGLALSSDGMLSGTPTNSGIFSFTILATDAYGCSDGRDYSVAVAGSPVILAQPQSQTVPMGSNVTLTVSADGVPAPTFQWYFNSSNISGALDTSLTLMNFQGSNEGSYFVTVGNGNGSVTSQTAELYLAEPLRFLNSRVDSNGLFRARLVGPAGTNFAVNGSTDLLNWTGLATNPAPLGIWDFTDTNENMAAPSNRFYRAWVSP
jgi:hypothetical protein